MEWDVTFYTNPDGDAPVQDFLFSLSDKEQSKFFAYLQLLIERGNTLPSQYAKPWAATYGNFARSSAEPSSGTSISQWWGR